MSHRSFKLYALLKHLEVLTTTLKFIFMFSSMSGKLHANQITGTDKSLWIPHEIFQQYLFMTLRYTKIKKTTTLIYQSKPLLKNNIHIAMCTNQ